MTLQPATPHTPPAPPHIPTIWFVSGTWVLLMVTALLTRPFLPVDETRYLAVAWEMWRDGNFLVPHLNGETYSHKPPLLFWAMHAGWAVFGVNEWWPRLIAPLFGLGSLFLTLTLARLMWPERRDIAATAPVLLMGAVFWTLFTTLTMFDMILTFCTLLGLNGLFLARRTHKPSRFWGGMGVTALAIGIGVLAKGPAILLHILPVALLAPLWVRDVDYPRWQRWYAAVLLAVLAGVGMAFLWAIPAAIAGGEAYANAIFWGQSAGRIVNSFAHQRGWWWYLATLPVLILPWIIWPPLWRAAKEFRPVFAERRVRLCLIWLGVAFVVFSLISGKQLHYLLPEFPALALIAARFMSPNPAENPETAAPTPGRVMDRIPPALFAIVFGILVLAAPYVPPLADHVAKMAVPPATLWGLLPIVIGVVAYKCPGNAPLPRLMTLASISTALVVTVHLALMPVMSAAYDLGAAARQIDAWQRQDIAVAHAGKYHGQFQFLGRLSKPIEAIDPNTAAKWAQENPSGMLITYRRVMPTSPPAEAVHAFRGRFIVVWNAARIAENPALAHRR